jgi:hypothetical protein
MGGEIELSRLRPATPEFFLECAGEAKNTNAMALGIGDEDAIAYDGDGTRALEVIGDLETQFAVVGESDDLCKSRIRNEECPVSFGNSDRGEEPDWANLFPTMPFSSLTIVKANGVGARIGDAKILVFVEGEAERLLEDIDGFAAAGEPLSKAFQSGGFSTEIAGSGQAADIGDARRFRRRWPDPGGSRS